MDVPPEACSSNMLHDVSMMREGMASPYENSLDRKSNILVRFVPILLWSRWSLRHRQNVEAILQIPFYAMKVLLRLCQHTGHLLVLRKYIYLQLPQDSNLTYVCHEAVHASLV